MLHTYQGGFVVLREVSTSDATLSPEANNMNWSDLSVGVVSEVDGGYIRVGEEYNGCEIICLCGSSAVDDTSVGDASDGISFELDVFGYAEGGPAEQLFDASCTVGLCRYEDSTLALWVDTVDITTSEDFVANGVVVKDTGNDRIARIFFDLCGYRYLRGVVYSLSEDCKVSVKVRPW